jgi:photosystem I P700 chlorophyll a apoprotein A2
MYSLPAYAFIAQDFPTQAALYAHHQYIAQFIMAGAFGHGAIFSLGITIRNRMKIMYWQEC